MQNISGFKPNCDELFGAPGVPGVPDAPSVIHSVEPAPAPRSVVYSLRPGLRIGAHLSPETKQIESLLTALDALTQEGLSGLAQSSLQEFFKESPQEIPIELTFTPDEFDKCF